MYQRYYILTDENQIGDPPKGASLSQKTDKASRDDSDFSFGSILVPEKYQKEGHILDWVHLSKFARKQ